MARDAHRQFRMNVMASASRSDGEPVNASGRNLIDVHVRASLMVKHLHIGCCSRGLVRTPFKTLVTAGEELHRDGPSIL